MNAWYTRSKPTDNQGLVIDEATGATIAVTYDPKNAPLVAAAPAMLEALQSVLSSVPFASYRGDGELEECERRVIDAIRSAHPEGGQS